MKKLSYGAKEKSGLDYMAVEISYGSRWINLNDTENFRINADQTRTATAKTWRKTVAESPVLGGNYLIHAVPEMVMESVGLWVYGRDQTALADNYWQAQEMFEQWDYRIRWTFNEYREYWRCQLADSQGDRGQVWTHNGMASMSFSVPRYPDVERERIG